MCYKVPSKYISDLKSLHKCHYFSATYSFFRIRKWKTSPAWNIYSSRDFQFFVLFSRGLPKGEVSSMDLHLNWILDVPKEQTSKHSRTDNLNNELLNTYVAGDSMGKVRVFSLDLCIFTTYFTWVAVCNICSWQAFLHYFRVNESCGFKQQWCTEVSWSLRFFSTATLCALSQLKCAELESSEQ